MVVKEENEMGLIFQFISVECKSYAEIGTRVEGSPTNQQHLNTIYFTSRKWIHGRIVCGDRH